jgi:N,N'-diacetyllegionaminate synthase
MLFIAEIGLNHNGNLDLAFELIRRAKESGASIAKFQLGWKGAPGELNHIDEDGLRTLDKWCGYFDIEFMVSVFTDEAYDLARRIDFRRYKIASRTVKDRPELVERIIAEGKETIISLGMWDGPDLPFTAPNVKYLWCKSKYPSQPWDLTDLPKSFAGSPYTGYSDHSVGIEVPLMAIARGAQIVEKHLTLDKSDRTIRDHVLSATPDEFRMLTLLGTNIAKNVRLGV